VRTIGAGYLIFLGVQALRRAWQQNPKRLFIENAAITTSQRRSLLDGFVTNLFSPETIMFYFATVPQFIQPGEALLAKTLLLASIHFVMRLVWYAPVVLFVVHIRLCLNRPHIQQGIEGATGTLLIAFGVRLLTTRR
jgi:threonine/homoserine/homoserine lactone efflux protein